MAGRKGEKVWADAVRRAVNRRMEGVEGQPKRLELIAQRLIDMALDGDAASIREIGDRLDGRATQSVDSNINVKGSLTLEKKIVR